MNVMLAVNPTALATTVAKAFALQHPTTCSGDVAHKELVEGVTVVQQQKAVAEGGVGSRVQQCVSVS